MKSLPLTPAGSAFGSSAGQVQSLDRFEYCRAAGSSGSSACTDGYDDALTPAESATDAHDRSMPLYARAWQLRVDSDFSGLGDPVMRDIACRDHVQTISAHLRMYPQSPFATELQETIVALRADSSHFSRLRKSGWHRAS